MFDCTVTGLLPNTTYYAKSYATNSFGTAYGNEISFKSKEATIPIIASTTGPSSITQTTAISGGTILVSGKTNITSKGICWSSTNTTPTIVNSKTNDGTGSGSFTSALSNLIPNTNYYIRAYATNSLGTGYGNVLVFKTSVASIPTGVTTVNISSITQTSAISGGIIATDGGSPILSKGLCWSNSNLNPTLSNSSNNIGTGLSSFSSTLTGLTPNTNYYVRAYATNSVGTAYGSVINFRTNTALTVGSVHQGGVIGYVFVQGDSGYVTGETHGLIVSGSNLTISTNNSVTSGFSWGCSGTSINTGTVLGTGLNNTNLITNNCNTSSTAAALCQNFVSDGYTDWYLPSYTELRLLYLNKLIIGGFLNTYYWTSSQSSSSTAWSVNFSNGSFVNTNKSSLLYVRAIRKF
jgi:hypothetical protein